MKIRYVLRQSDLHSLSKHLEYADTCLDMWYPDIARTPRSLCKPLRPKLRMHLSQGYGGHRVAMFFAAVNRTHQVYVMGFDCPPSPVQQCMVWQAACRYHTLCKSDDNRRRK